MNYAETRKLKAELAEKDAEIARLREALHSAEADMKERCAKVADEWATDEQRKYGNGGPAAAIRAMEE